MNQISQAAIDRVRAVRAAHSYGAAPGYSASVVRHGFVAPPAQAEGTDEAAEIVVICQLAGYAEKAGSFLAEKKPMVEVIALLQQIKTEAEANGKEAFARSLLKRAEQIAAQMKAAADAKEISNKQTGKAAPVNNAREGFAGLLLQQAEQIAAQMKGDLYQAH